MTDTQSAYLEVLADLKRRQDGIAQLIGELEALVGSEHIKQSIADMPLQGMKVIDAAKAVLRENGGPMSPAAITERIKAGGCRVSSPNTVASILHRYARDNDDVFSPDRGLWDIRSNVTDAEPKARTSALAEVLASNIAASLQGQPAKPPTLGNAIAGGLQPIPPGPPTLGNAIAGGLQPIPPGPPTLGNAIAGGLQPIPPGPPTLGNAIAGGLQPIPPAKPPTLGNAIAGGLQPIPPGPPKNRD